MNPKLRPTLVVAALALLAGACVHTPPGTSVEIALAKKPELVKLATPVLPPGQPVPTVRVPAVEPPMPDQGRMVESVGDAFSRGTFCLKAGQDAAAIEAFEEAVKLDPTFADAWQNLAALYEKNGDEKKAMEAFRRAKKIARQ
ncbi:MAG: hypothetical protein QOE70_6105 [Chthoniobacter sp.]|nr:hypothetical protein [Chthoniobacter sp.]